MGMVCGVNSPKFWQTYSKYTASECSVLLDAFGGCGIIYNNIHASKKKKKKGKKVKTKRNPTQVKKTGPFS